MSTSTETIEVVVASVTVEAERIHAWELRRPEREPLPPFAAGAHIELHLANGLERSYSLCNSQDERDRYVIAVSKDPQSRGGSRFIHEHLKVGDRIRISAPLNHFQLVEDAGHNVFIAGGIGITPIWCMIQRLEALGRHWELHYSARIRQLCAFRDRLLELERSKPGRVHLNFDQEPGAKMTDLKALIASLPSDAHLYCCGPNPMLSAFESAVKELGRPSTHVHVEYFTAKEKSAVEGGFTVVLKRCGASYFVPPGKTILETLLENNIDVAYSCMEGVCGTCQTAVLEGVPDHRDSVLSAEEHAANRTMMICCSGSKGPRLVLDL
jgi:tetrachlorobenzoquinone reductase